MANFQIRLDHKDLERLLGVPPKGEEAEPDSVFVRFSNAAVQQFATRHIKAFINTRAISQVEDALRPSIDEAVKEALMVWDPDRRTYFVKSEIEHSVNIAADLIITRLVLEKTQERLAALNVPAMIDAAVETHVKDEVILALRRRTQEEYMSVVDAEQRLIADVSLDNVVRESALRQIYGAGMKPRPGG